MEAINFPSLEEWTLHARSEPLPVTTMISLVERSGCYLKILKLEEVPNCTNLRILLQAIPSLEHLRVYFWPDRSYDVEMDDILAQIFGSPYGANTMLPEETTRTSFLPTSGLWIVQQTTTRCLHHFLGITYRNSIARATDAH